MEKLGLLQDTEIESIIEKSNAVDVKADPASSLSVAGGAAGGLAAGASAAGLYSSR